MSEIETCPTCGTAFGDDSDYALGQAIGKMHGSYYGRENWHGWQTKAIGFTQHYNDHDVILVDKKLDAVEDQGANHQPVHLVFEYNGRYFRKDGWGDSYGDITWGGPFREVQKTTEEVVVFK